MQQKPKEKSNQEERMPRRVVLFVIHITTSKVMCNTTIRCLWTEIKTLPAFDIWNCCVIHRTDFFLPAMNWVCHHRTSHVHESGLFGIRQICTFTVKHRDNLGHRRSICCTFLNTVETYVHNSQNHMHTKKGYIK